MQSWATLKFSFLSYYWGPPKKNTASDDNEWHGSALKPDYAKKYIENKDSELNGSALKRIMKRNSLKTWGRHQKQR